MLTVGTEPYRTHPSLHLFTAGGTLPAHTTAVINTFLLHRDSAVFPDPDTFDPDRFLPDVSASRDPFTFVPFSAGPRNCIGQSQSLFLKFR